MKKALLVLSVGILLFGTPRASSAQFVCCDFPDIVDMSPSFGVGWGLNDGGGFVAAAKIMVLKADSVRLIGFGVAYARYGDEEDGPGNKFLFTIVPIGIGGKNWYFAAEFTPYSIGRSVELLQSGNVTVTENRKYGPAVLVTLNVHF